MLAQSVLRYVKVMDQQKDGTASQDGRQEKEKKRKEKKKKERKEKKVEEKNRSEIKRKDKKRKEKRAATQRSKNQTGISMSSWCGKDDTRDTREGRDRAAKIMAMITEEKKTSLKTTKPRTQGDAADAAMQSTGIPSIWRGTGQHSKEQRLGLRIYGSHFSPPDNAP